MLRKTVMMARSDESSRSNGTSMMNDHRIKGIRRMKLDQQYQVQRAKQQRFCWVVPDIDVAG